MTIFQISALRPLTDVLVYEAVVSPVEHSRIYDTVDLPLQKINIYVGARNSLMAAKVRTVGDLCAMSATDLLSIRGIGNTSLKRVRRALREVGLSLRDEHFLENFE